MLELPDLQTEFDSLSSVSACATYKSKVDATVAEWRCATHEMFDLELFQREKHKMPRGRWIAALDDSVNPKCFKHGFDEQKRLVVVRQHCGSREYETFYDYLNTYTQRVVFGNNNLVSVSRLYIDDGIPARFARITTGSRAVSIYEYDGDDLISESLTFIDQRGLLKGGRYDFTYGSDKGAPDVVTFVDVDPATRQQLGDERIVYRRPVKHVSLKAQFAQTENALIVGINSVIESSMISDVVYCLLLVYDAENDLLPPLLALGRQLDRDIAITKYGPCANQHLWNPADFKYFNIPSLEIRNGEVLEACQLMNQQLAAKEQYTAAKRLLNNVAARLMKRDWRAIMNTTDDFVVVAVGLESQDDLEQNIKKSVSVDRIRQLKQSRLL